MNKSKSRNKNASWLTVPLAMEKSNLGRASVMKIASDNKCVIKIGKSVRIDWVSFEKALELYRV